MDSTAFLQNEKVGEYDATVRVAGEVFLRIKAGSIEEAKAKARKMTEDDEFGLEIDAVIDVGYPAVSKTPPMYLITRDGKAMQVSHLVEGDEPRQPTKTGF